MLSSIIFIIFLVVLFYSIFGATYFDIVHKKNLQIYNLSKIKKLVWICGLIVVIQHYGEKTILRIKDYHYQFINWLKK